jgi:uncharacterized protein YkwD
MSRRAWGSSLFGVLLVVLSALPASAQSTGTETASRAAAVSAPTKFESDLLMYINNRRTLVGCAKLTYNSYLAYAARQHTSRMVAAQELSHQLARESSLGVRITNAGYVNWRMLAENLAYGPTSPWGVYTLWMGSAPHRANIENCSLRNAGLGVAWVNGKSWSTIDFGRQ